jgi:two-component system OmpR family sensor kinase
MTSAEHNDAFHLEDSSITPHGEATQEAESVRPSAIDDTQPDMSQELRQILRSINHDLRTPLSRVSMRAYLNRRHIEAGRLEQATQETARIEAEVLTMRRILDRIGLLYQLSSHAPLSLEYARLHDLVETQVASQQTHQPDIVFALHIESVQPIQINVDLVNQAIRELLDNAIHHNTTAPVKQVGVHLREERRQIVLRVTDNGGGIPSQHQAHIFTPFYRVDAARTTDRDEQGLGLTLAQQITALMGGTLELESSSDEGATFALRLPLD